MAQKQADTWFLIQVCNKTTVWNGTKYCKTRFFRVPFISRISRAWQVRENLGPRKFEYTAFQCSRKQKRQNYGVQNKYIDTNAKIKGGQN